MLFRVCACVILCFVWLLNVFIVFQSQFSIRNLLITQLNKLSDYLTIKMNYSLNNLACMEVNNILCPSIDLAMPIIW